MENLEKIIQKVVELYKTKKITEAELLGKKLITENPKVSYLYNLLGLVLIENKKFDEAQKFFEKGLSLKPSYAMIYNNMGTLFKLKGEYTKAESCYKKSINLDEKLYETHNNIGTLYLDINKYDEAIKAFLKSVNIKSENFIAHYNLGIAYKAIGNFNKSISSLNTAIKLYPNFFKAHRALSQLVKYKKNDKHFKVLKNLYAETKNNSSGKMEISFALGKAYEDIKDFSNAMKCFDAGNEIRRKNITFSIEKEKKEFSEIKNLFKSKEINYNKIIPDKKKSVIFILGMPRSGTTLVEQIISGHPKVFGGDELIFFNDLIKKNFYINDTLSSEYVLKSNIENLKKIGKNYIDSIKSLSSKSVITDKLPINFKWIGFIKLILPNSKIVHCVRNPKDTCLSIYKNYFTNNELNYAYNYNELVDFYNLYTDLMKFWNDLYPNYIINFEYEKLILEPKYEIKKLIKFCDLKWNDDCLKFYNNKRAIKTASDVQVRNKIYNNSVNSWKKYKKYLNKYFFNLKI